MRQDGNSYGTFGKDRILYTIQNKCKEEPDMEYDDGAASLFFYTKGKKGEVSLEYMKVYEWKQMIQLRLSGT